MSPGAILNWNQGTMEHVINYTMEPLSYEAWENLNHGTAAAKNNEAMKLWRSGTRKMKTRNFGTKEPRNNGTMKP